MHGNLIKPGKTGERRKETTKSNISCKYKVRCNNKVLLYSTGNYIQYPILNHNGKEYEKECIVVLMVKNPPANAGDIRDAGLIPGSGRSPGGGHGNPLQYI